MIGKINSFQSLGTLDGPGVRAVVFLQGCPLRCICCHNPETWAPDGGNTVTAEALFQKILRQKNYFGQTGGVTVSGGEPLLQAEFLQELFTLCKNAGIHTALDTSGCVLNAATKALLKKCDLVLLDYKYTNAAHYKAYTGMEKARVDEFLEYLAKNKIPTVLRQVIIPEKNDTKASVKVLCAVAKSHENVQKIELLPFKKLCLSKYDAMGLPFPLKDTPSPTAEQMAALEALIPKEYL